MKLVRTMKPRGVLVALTDVTAVRLFPLVVMQWWRSEDGGCFECFIGSEGEDWFQLIDKENES